LLHLSKNKKFEYIIISLIVVSAFFISYSMRTQPLKYGMEIDEFDPYYNYRATTYLVDNGFESYKNWHDELSWYPTGRDVFATSQTMLHLTAATLYQPFSSMMSLKEFVIYFPAVIGSLTVLPVFLLIRRITDGKVGALASMFFAISISFIQRGTAGWFKSEPLGLFYGIFGVYFFISGVMSIFEGKKIHGIIKLASAGLILAVGLSSWGGVIFFLIPILVWLIMIPGLKTKINNIEIGGYNIKSFIIGISIFSGVLMVVASLFARSSSVIQNYIGPSIILVICFIILEYILSTRFKWKYIKTVVVLGSCVVLFTVISTSTYIGSIVYGCTDDDSNWS